MIRIAGAARIALFGFALLIVPSCAGTESNQLVADDDLLITTFNVHYISQRQTRNTWASRRDAVIRVLESVGSDVIAFQEMETFAGGRFSAENLQLDWIFSHFPDYAFAATGDPESFPNTQPIMYQKARLTMIEQGFFFFSDSPDEIYSRPWHNGFPSFCTWVEFFDRNTQTEFYVFNVHLDSARMRNRVKSVDLLVQRVAAREHTDEPAIIVGDFNAFPGSISVRRVSAAGFDRSRAGGATYHLFRGINVVPQVDYIFAGNGLEILEAWRSRERYNGVFPSDHYPVTARVRMAGED